MFTAYQGPRTTIQLPLLTKLSTLSAAQIRGMYSCIPCAQVLTARLLHGVLYFLIKALIPVQSPAQLGSNTALLYLTRNLRLVAAGGRRSKGSHPRAGGARSRGARHPVTGQGREARLPGTSGGVRSGRPDQ